MKNFLPILALVVAAIALIFTFSTNNKTSSSNSVAQKVLDANTIKIGYIVYPPLLTKDQATGKLSGISYDLVEAAAKNLNVKTDWVEEVGWGTAIEGLKTHRYDILGTQMWPNSARSREAIFSVAPMNSNIYPYVKVGDNRFGDLSVLSSGQYTISALDGEMSSIIAKGDYPQSKANTLPQSSSMSEVLLNITNGKADITFIEPSVANDFAKTNPGKLVRVGSTPVRTFGNSFAMARGEESLRSMWNVAIQELINDGTVTKILQKYTVPGDYTLNK